MELKLTSDELVFVASYIETAEWADSPDDTLCVDPGKVVICPDWEREAVIDCLAFWSRWQCYLSEPSQAAHDFYLSRNGHGTGFWDDNGEHYPTWLADKMQAYAEAMGEHQIQYEESE
jgi:hypothetical protein